MMHKMLLLLLPVVLLEGIAGTAAAGRWCSHVAVAHAVAAPQTKCTPWQASSLQSFCFNACIVTLLVHCTSKQCCLLPWACTGLQA
jgi:hypothetical protein